MSASEPGIPFIFSGDTFLKDSLTASRTGKTNKGTYAMSKQPKLSTREAAAYLGVRPNTLEIWRCKHRGPKYAKLGSRIVYDPDDLDAYFAARSISTRDTELDRLGARK